MIFPTSSTQRPSRYSLWHEIGDGSASIVVRVLVNVTLGVFLTGAAFMLTFFAAALIPAFRRYGLHPTDEVAVATFVMASLAFVGGTVWLWSRKSRHRALLKPTIWTVAIGGVTSFICLVVADTFHGAGTILAFGLMLLAAAAAMLIWINACFQLSRGRPMHNREDGLPDIRCPACGYRMVGLHEARCPECGGSYTLDELLAKQGFSRAPVSRANREPAERVAAPTA